MIEVIALDADDTLWHNETIFSTTHERFRALLEPYEAPETTTARFEAAAKANLELFGFGVKGFALSMIETAIEVTDGRVTSAEIASIIELAKDMLRHPVELLEGVEEAIAALDPGHRLMLVTKGDLLDQESKLARSGLGDHFDAVEIVSRKDEAAYRRILERHAIAPERFVMVGNSLGSDVLPVVAVGAHAVYVPYPITSHLERVELDPDDDHGFVEIASLADLPEAVAELDRRAAVGGAAP